MSTIKCQYDLAWRGLCMKLVTGDGDKCPEHADIKCSSCGAPATHECDETMQFVCGEPLCPDCEHQIEADGTNGRTNKHCKKTDQKHRPWFMQDSPTIAPGRTNTTE